jgi:hypothetical protein
LNIYKCNESDIWAIDKYYIFHSHSEDNSELCRININDTHHNIEELDITKAGCTEKPPTAIRYL